MCGADGWMENCGKVTFSGKTSRFALAFYLYGRVFPLSTKKKKKNLLCHIEMENSQKHFFVLILLLKLKFLLWITYLSYSLAITQKKVLSLGSLYQHGCDSAAGKIAFKHQLNKQKLHNSASVWKKTLECRKDKQTVKCPNVISALLGSSTNQITGTNSCTFIKLKLKFLLK